MSRTKLVPLFLILLGSALVVVVGVGNPFGTPSLVNFRDPVPQPNIRLIEVEIVRSTEICRIRADDVLPVNTSGLNAEVRFSLVNSGEEDGFAIVEMTVRDVVMDSNRYFVRAEETQLQILSFEDLSCSITLEEIDVRVANIEGP